MGKTYKFADWSLTLTLEGDGFILFRGDAAKTFEKISLFPSHGEYLSREDGEGHPLKKVEIFNNNL